ncbi:GerMN domain-containing protein [Schnuerera sp.]|uniref:GerMN domain-containing protein n=1 Tax=Schnuerera sp. TaxID=2794844 RepID=UPI002B9B3730|nr:GerMN domain-containing protein [Schnuerera sp.]HSH35966.1 GerMN domain-containing protein [Schnuerera sp.]
MKKILSLISILLFISLILVSCGETQEPPGDDAVVEPEEEVLTIKDFYPFKENWKMEYEGIGNEFAEQTTFFEFIEENKGQLKIFNPGTVMVKVLEYDEGELKEIFSEGEFYHIENMIDVKNENNNIILKEPLKVGTSWTTSGGYKSSITGIDVNIETPYKNFKALEVTTEFGEGRKQLEYYAKDVGPVASIYIDGEFEVKTLLEEIENESYEMDVKFFYPMFDEIKTGYVERDIEFSTNGNIKEILEYNLKNPNMNELISPISDNTKVNSIILDRGNQMVKVDFSNELLEDMNAGSAMEGEIIKSIVNTFANFYQVEKVYISTEGNPYSSGHFSINKDEFFTVDYSNIEELDE